MDSPQISFRVPPETYEALVKLAAIEGKALAQLIRELVDLGLSIRTERVEASETLDELKTMRAEVREALDRAILASATGAYYANAAVQTLVAKPDVKVDFTNVNWKKGVNEVRRHYLEEPLDTLYPRLKVEGMSDEHET